MCKCVERFECGKFVKLSDSAHAGPEQAPEELKLFEETSLFVVLKGYASHECQCCGGLLVLYYLPPEKLKNMLQIRRQDFQQNYRNDSLEGTHLL